MNFLPTYEVWTWIKGYEGRFEVSNRGRIRSWVKPGGTVNKKGIIKFRTDPYVLKTQPCIHGYHQTHVGNKAMSDVKMIRVHREVAILYCINPDPKTKIEVNHINGNKNCNEWWNFEWVNRIESIDHAFRTRLIKPAIGEQQSNTKLRNEQVLEIFHSTLKTRQLAILYNISTHAILDIKRGRTWWHLTGKERHIKLSEYGRFKYQI